MSLHKCNHDEQVSLRKHSIIAEAEAYCRERGIRFTAPRAAVLDVIAGSAKPVGAYDIIARMETGQGNAKPATVYRALEFLTLHGFVHKIESLNAFVACHAGHMHDGAQFTLCGSCGNVEEVHLCQIPTSIQKKLDDTGFRLTRWNAELHGLCRNCQP